MVDSAGGRKQTVWGTDKIAVFLQLLDVRECLKIALRILRSQRLLRRSRMRLWVDSLGGLGGNGLFYEMRITNK